MSFFMHAKCVWSAVARNLKPFTVTKLSTPHEHSLREAFQENTVKRIQIECCQDGSVEEKWSVIRSALTKTAELVIATVSRHQPDSFRESEATILPALQYRTHCYTKWLATGNLADLQKFQCAMQKHTE